MAVHYKDTQENTDDSLRMFKAKEVYTKLNIPEWKFYALRQEGIFPSGVKDGRSTVYGWEEVEQCRQALARMNQAPEESALSNEGTRETRIEDEVSVQTEPEMAFSPVQEEPRFSLAELHQALQANDRLATMKQELVQDLEALVQSFQQQVANLILKYR